MEKKGQKKRVKGQNKNWFLPLYSKQSLVQDFLRLSIPKLLLCLFWPQCCHLQALAWPWVALKKSREKKLNLGILLAWTLNQLGWEHVSSFFRFIFKQLKLIISNSTILFRPGFHCHIFLHLLSHFDKEKNRKTPAQARIRTRDLRVRRRR